MIYWQELTVALIVLAATAYVVNRAMMRLRSLHAATSEDIALSSCASGCDDCGISKQRAAVDTGRILVQIDRAAASAASHRAAK